MPKKSRRISTFCSNLGITIVTPSKCSCSLLLALLLVVVKHLLFFI